MLRLFSYFSSLPLPSFSSLKSARRMNRVMYYSPLFFQMYSRSQVSVPSLRWTSTSSVPSSSKRNNKSIGNVDELKNTLKDALERYNSKWHDWYRDRDGGDKSGGDSLELLCDWGSPEIVKLVQSDKKLLYSFVFAGLHNHVDILQVCIKNGIKMDNEDWTALMRATHGNCEESVRLLLDHDVDVDARSNMYHLWDETALMIASRRHYTKIVEMLLQKNANVDIQDSLGWTALMCASQSGNVAIVEMLLRKNAKLDLQDEDGWTALMFACNEHHLEVAQLLLKHNSDVEIKNNRESTALMIASFSGHSKIVEILMEKASVTSKTLLLMLSWAIEQGNVNHFQSLLHNNANVQLTNEDGQAALMIATRRNQVQVAELLLKKGVSPDCVFPNGSTALIHASSRGHEELVALLLDHNANVNAKDSDGNTALILASQHGHTKTVALLLKKSVNVDEYR